MIEEIQVEAKKVQHINLLVHCLQDTIKYWWCYYANFAKTNGMLYKIPDQTRIGHVHLKVADLERSLKFYRDILGFAVMQYYGNSAVFISAGGYHHHIGLNTWYSKNGSPPPAHSTGLFHTAILYPTRVDLAIALKRLDDAKYPLTGASDHGVSHAIYLDDPDGNGVELYWDKPKEDWPVDKEGNLQLVTEPLDLRELLQLAGTSTKEEA